MRAVHVRAKLMDLAAKVWNKKIFGKTKAWNKQESSPVINFTKIESVK